MENPDKLPRPEAKLKNLEPEALEFLWDQRFKDEEGKRLNKKLSAIQPEIALRFGFTVSRSTLSLFYVWLKLKREWDADAMAADAAKEEYQRENPQASQEEVIKVGNLKFLSRAARRGDDKAWSRLLRTITARENAALAKEKAADARLTKVEAGLDAMEAEIQGNAPALKAFRAMKEALRK